MTTPLGRAAAVIRRELQDYIVGFNDTDWDRFSHNLADSVLGAAQLPDSYDTATELRIANLLAVVKYPATIPQGDRVRVVALMRALEMLGLDAGPRS